ncbi:MAG TPA: ABC transporter ATP-binding protein [Pirellulales bacterium]|nr:ABC transporter ATP-binding protein [Pirellulales bacterium]
MKPAIQVEGLSKSYRISGGDRGQYRTLRESLTGAALAPWHGFRRLVGNGPPARTQNAQTVRALDDVSLEVRPGEVVGVIGRNGAGKSTLLKIISRVTEPTAGRVALRGRLASLLEVGTGFHAELTGRENIYLSGAVLGMSKRDLARQFDAIVDFAEIGGYLDTPVKRYSSGMLVRLAFAVAAHLEPDILLLDEVLAVGDAGFRAKCIRRMKELISSNVAVLFVSHQRSQIVQVCQRCVVLHQGRLVYSGNPEAAWQQYVDTLQAAPATVNFASACQSGGRLLGLTITDADGRATTSVAANEPLSLTVAYQLDRQIDRLGLGINFHQGNGDLLADWTTFDCGVEIPRLPGRHSLRLDLEGLPVSGGSYLIGVRLYDLQSGDALDRHFQRYPLMVNGPADQHLISLRQRWTHSTTEIKRRPAQTDLLEI